MPPKPIAAYRSQDIAGALVDAVESSPRERVIGTTTQLLRAAYVTARPLTEALAARAVRRIIDAAAAMPPGDGLWAPSGHGQSQVGIALHLGAWRARAVERLAR
jgi:hypothetical protein